MTPRPATPPASTHFPWFLGGVGSWFFAWGLNSVVFSWLLVGELRLSGEWVGIGQMATMLPSLALLLVGGATADRFDPRSLLIGLHALAVVPVAVLVAALVLGWLTLPLLLAYAVCLGTLSAFTLPARDSLLSRVAGSDMLRAVTGMTACQFGGQAIGTFMGGAAEWIGNAPLLSAQALVLLAGSFLTLRVPAAPPHPRTGPRGSALREMGEGIRQMLREPRLRSPLLLVIAVGFLFVGPFMVTFPLLVRDYYQGDQTDLSFVFATFPIATFTGSLVLRRRGIRRKGRALLLALVFGALSLGAIGSGLPFAGMLAAAFLWGLGGAVFINSSRTLYQEAAPAEQRARVLALYQLGFMGAAPLGALCAGFASGQVGSLASLLLFAAGMLIVVFVAWLFTDIVHMD